MRVSPNSQCPCGSTKKYKKCCQIYHKGAVAKDALILMKSRYSAYAVGDSSYIVKTTHTQNIDYQENKKIWRDEVDTFCKNDQFLKLEILEFINGELEAFVKFKATLGSGVMVERSRFLKISNSWFYIDGEFE